MKPGRGFRRQGPPPRPCKTTTYTPRPRDTVIARMQDLDRAIVQVQKTHGVRHEGYRRLVATLRCIRCMRVGSTQAAHPNTGKGGMLKTDDRLCFPLCTDGPGRVGCHTLFDQGALYPKEQRRLIEPVWGRLTRRTVTVLLGWPKDLPPWPDDDFVDVAATELLTEDA